jgi:fucose permease
MTSRRRALLLSLAYLGFISLGLPDGVLGVAWPSIRASFLLPLDAVGSLLAMSASGYVLSSLLSGHILSRMNVGALLAVSCVATATSLLAYAVTPLWSIMVATAFVAGLGAGAIDAGINTYMATQFGARTLNWLHAFYGIGATSGPLIMTQVMLAGRAWRWGYAVVGLGVLALGACFAVTRALWATPTDATPSAGAHGAVPLASTLRLPATWLYLAAFFVYTGIEACFGAWMYSVFAEGRGIPMATAGAWASAYWGALTAGRVGFGFVVGHAGLHQLLRASLLMIVGGATLVCLHLTPLLSLLGLLLAGLGCGPIFPSLIATTPRRLGEAHTANAVGFQVAAAALGQALLPTVMGTLAAGAGLEVIPVGLMLAGIFLGWLYELLARARPVAANAITPTPAIDVA